MNQLGHKLRLAFYEASDGPRIMIFGPLDADFAALQKLFVQLSQSRGMSCKLEEQSFIVAFGGLSVEASCLGPMFSDKRSTVEGIRRIQESEPVFEWQQTAEEWDHLSELIDGLMASTLAGHQYLTSYPSEDAIVVVSKGEYGDDVLEKLGPK
jgi:hypothetical protein